LVPVSLGSSLSAQDLPEPDLLTAQLPRCPSGEGEVKASFALNGAGEVISVEITSTSTPNNELRKATEEDIRSWKFAIPRDTYRTDWRYETTFRYRLSGNEVSYPQKPRLIVIFESFRSVEVITDIVKIATVLE
jgi:TonB family protein